MIKKKVAIIGVGGYLAAMLLGESSEYADITLIARGAKKEALCQYGLRLKKNDGTETIVFAQRIAESASDLNDIQDIIFICVKNYSLDAVVASLGACVGPQTLIIPVMNGVEAPERIRKGLVLGEVACASIHIVAYLETDSVIEAVNGPLTVVHNSNYALLRIGIPGADSEQKKLLQNAHCFIEKAKIPCELREDILAAIWEKYILNCAYNVLTAYYDTNVGGLRRSKQRKKEYYILLEEAMKVAAALNIELSTDFMAKETRRFEHGLKDSDGSSLQRDMHAKRQSELMTFGGYLIRKAAELNVSVPLSDRLYRELYARESLIDLQYIKGTNLPMEDLVDFADLVFSKSAGSTDFQTLVPRLYDPHVDTREYHYLAVRDGKIKAMVCVLPQTLMVNGQELSFCSLGTVSVHPREQGAGHMRKLMQMAVLDMEKEGHDLCVLQGLRQRYEYFGFFPTGMRNEFTILDENVKHAYKRFPYEHITFKEIDPASASFYKAAELYRSGAICNLLDDDALFYRMSNYNSHFLSIKNDGEWSGYCCVSKDYKTCFEWKTNEKINIGEVIKAYFYRYQITGLSFRTGPCDEDINAHLAVVCQAHTIHWDGNYKIINMKKVAKILLELRAARGPLADGELVVEIEERERLKIIVKSKEIVVDETTEEAHISVSEKEAHVFLFSHIGYEILGSRIKELPECVCSWLPLPLHLSMQDNI